MAHVKKLVMQGFKSFAKKTEIPFDQGINVIIGPNGSGKSNISDAICFVLGRLSVKSMRAEKARNLIFMGSKYQRPAKEAIVEMVFDNKDRAFSLDKDDISIKRIVKLQGGSTYKINDETKTRAEVVETLGQAGIDPYGYNLILQGQIQSVVKMHGEERRKIIGEVAGISVYEWRKEKSLKELEKTEGRLKEIGTILRERTSYLNNLEKEKAAAQRYKDLQLVVQRSKASILKKKHDDKVKEISSLVKTISEKMEQKDKMSEKALGFQEDMDKLSEKVNQINKHIRDATGLEQGRLREEITNLRAELEGLKVRREGFDHRKDEVERRIEEMTKNIPELREEISKLREESPLVAKKSQELKKKKDELAALEIERKKALTLKSDLNSLRERIEDKKRQLGRATGESETLVKTIEELSAELEFNSEKECVEAIEFFRKSLGKEEDRLEAMREEELKSEKIISVAESGISYNEEIKSKISKLDVCPMCQSKMTEEHVGHVTGEANSKISRAKSDLEAAKERVEKISRDRSEVRKKILGLEDKISKYERELNSLRNVLDKKTVLKKSVENENFLKKEISDLEKRRGGLEGKGDDLSKIDEKYSNKILEIEEISSRTMEDVDTTLLYKERELEKTKNIIERNKEDLKEISEQVEKMDGEIESKEGLLEKREEKQKELNVRFQKMFQDRDDTQNKFQETSIKFNEIQSESRQMEDQINYLKIGKAKLDGERETVEMDMSEYQGVELLQGSLQVLEEKLRKSQSALENIGSINMRALEVYEDVRKEYEVVREKVETLEKERNDILKIIEEIDKKKKKTFM
ncbi:MAG: AAA family ATPase, partial [Nanoarchaeota archaeon]|nr:AAA family ATPase [Nanoarchaeota archaeon]